MRVRIVNIHRGKAEQHREHIVYAELREVPSNQLIISATLGYIAERLEEDTSYELEDWSEPR